MAYLRLLGNEIGYMKTSDMRKMVESLLMYYHVFIRILPAQVRSTVSRNEKELRKSMRDLCQVLSYSFMYLHSLP